MEEIKILGISVENRLNASVKVQELLTKYGCSIKTRLGLHEVTSNNCATNGLIILQLTGEKSEWEKLEAALRAVDGVNVQQMVF